MMDQPDQHYILASIRWVLVLPGAVVALVLAYLLAELANYIASVIGVIGGLRTDGTPGLIAEAIDLIIFGVVGGYAFVAAAVELAPARKRNVAVVFGVLPTFYSVLQISLFLLNFFFFFGKIRFSTIFGNFFIAAGAVIAAHEVYKAGALSIAEFLPWSSR